MSSHRFSLSSRHQGHFWILNGHQRRCALFSKADACRRCPGRIEGPGTKMEKLPPHHSLSRPNHPSVLYRYVNLLIHRGPKNIDALKTFRFAVGERDERISVGISERLQKLETGRLT
jgi:hypothetical protein